MLPIRVGTILYGFCGGCFGRDSYHDKRVEAIGADWIVVRDCETGHPDFAVGDNIEAKLSEYTDPKCKAPKW